MSLYIKCQLTLICPDKCQVGYVCMYVCMYVLYNVNFNGGKFQRIGGQEKLMSKIFDGNVSGLRICKQKNF